MPCGHLNAMRFAQKPLPQPAYSFVQVPKAKSTTLENSSLQRIENREHFQTCMAEMLLLSKEAVRRRKYTTDDVDTHRASKPLSLEFIADKVDIDEPCWGYLVRTKTKPEVLSDTKPGVSPNNTAQEETNTPSEMVPENTKMVLSADVSPQNQLQQWKEGMLQGFITVTTFTNWQKTFRWDSLHHEAYGFDPPALIAQRKNGQRKWDSTGEIAKELQQTVHKGDIWNEGIVWPRIAEISLLGALGCGKTLVKLVLEDLENLKASSEQNYDYVVLQATDNSIPFYESLGFVRVGGIMEERNQDEEDVEPTSELITSEVLTYITKKRGEIPQHIAKKLNLDVLDIIFLNKRAMPEITPTSRLLLGTTLEVPVLPTNAPQAKPTRVSTRKTTPTDDKDKAGKIKSQRRTTNTNTQTDNDGIQWYIARENDTPTRIAKVFSVNCQELIKANVARLPGLMAKSRLKNGTRVQVSHLHIVTKVWTAYAHWSSPERQSEPGEPSYMMCYKLQKRCRRKEPIAPVRGSLQTSIENYKPTPLLWAPHSLDPDECTVAAKSDVGVKRLGPPLEVVAAQGSSSSKTPSTHVLVARDTNRDALVQVKVFTEGEMVKPSPLPPSKTMPANSNDTLALKKPKRAVGSFVLFCQDMRKRKKELLEGLSIAAASRVLADRWQKAPQKIKQKFEKMALEAKQEYLGKKQEYDEQLSLEQEKHKEERRESFESNSSGSRTKGKVDTARSSAAKKQKEHTVLFNKVIKIKTEALPFTARVMPTDEEVLESGEDKSDDPTVCPSLQPEKYSFWFCLTYVPDLQWVHLVPLVATSTFTAEDKKPRLLGKTKWKLVNAKLAQEIDISSRYVVPVKSRETKRSADADNEEWVIFDEEDEKETSSVKSSGSKIGRKRSSSTSPSRSVNKRVADPILQSQPTPVRQVSAHAESAARASTDKSYDMEMAAAVPTSELQSEQCEVAPSKLQMTLPPMDLDLSLLQKNGGSEYNSRSESSGSPPTSGSSPPCTCRSNVPCPVHYPPPQFQYIPRHPPSGAYPSPHGYPHHNGAMNPHHYHEHEPSGLHYPPHHHHHRRHDAPFPQQSSYEYAHQPPTPPQTPCQPTSECRPDLSVEREVAL